MANEDFSTGSRTAPQAPVPPPAPPVPPVPPAPPRYRRRGGIGLGVVLIALGVIFLIAQFVPGIAWWQMWPLIVILIGGIQIITPDPRDGWGISRIMDGVGTLIVGFVLLGNTTGVISWGVWWTLLMLWPVFIIAIGLAIIGRAIGQSWVRSLSPLVIWIAFAYAVATSFTGVGGFQPIRPMLLGTGQAFDVSQPLDGVTAASLTFDGGAGDINIADTSGALVTASGRSPFGTPDFVVKRLGTTADIRFGLGEHNNVVVVPGFSAGSVDVGLADSVLWDATLQTGASSMSADFRHVRLKSLTVKTGASSVDLKLGEIPEAITTDNVTVKAGVSSVDISVPLDVAVRIVTSNGLSSTNVSRGFESKGPGTWETPGYGSAARTYDINIESGVGSVSVKQS